MPDPALPVSPAPATPESDEAFNLVREFKDLLGRPYAGIVTIKRIDPAPYLSLSLSITDGRIRADLPFGRYRLGAMMRDAAGVRAYTAEEVIVSEAPRD